MYHAIMVDMNEQNLDINLIMQAFQEKVSQLVTEIVIKEATIKQLTTQLTQVQSSNDGFESPIESIKKVK
jgi:septal ring factor EnvC (AmiA/AmiB activator)